MDRRFWCTIVCPLIKWTVINKKIEKMPILIREYGVNQLHLIMYFL